MQTTRPIYPLNFVLKEIVTPAGFIFSNFLDSLNIAFLEVSLDAALYLIIFSFLCQLNV